MNITNDIDRVKEVVNKYFCSTHIADIKTLQRIFHPQAFISGTIDGQYYDWPLGSFLQRVSSANFKVDSVYDKQILNIECLDTIAFVKAHVVVEPYTFIDFITLVKIDNDWFIRHKSFAGEI